MVKFHWLTNYISTNRMVVDDTSYKIIKKIYIKHIENQVSLNVNMFQLAGAK